MRQHEENFGNLPADLQLTKACGFYEKCLSMTVLLGRNQDRLCAGRRDSIPVISRGVDKYVTEFAVDHTKPVHVDEAPSSTGKLVAIKQGTEQLTAPGSSRN